MSATKPRLAACPNCKKLIEYSLDNKFRPFCSERCKLIDLGDWANEQYKIPVRPKLDELTELDDLADLSNLDDNTH